MSTSKTGKHGHAKCHFVAVDIFNKKKYEDLTPSTHNMDVPFVSKTEFEVADVQDDGFLSLMDANGNMKDDLQLPSGDDEDYKVAEAIKAYFNDGKTVMVSVTKVRGSALPPTDSNLFTFQPLWRSQLIRQPARSPLAGALFCPVMAIMLNPLHRLSRE